MDPLKTLWMGNIENWMDENYINQILNSINIKPIKIRILQNENPKSCCFIEFEFPEIANFILQKYNGYKLKDFEVKLNKVNNKNNKKEKGNNLFKENNNNIINNKFGIYVGNIPKDINNEELKNYFQKDFPSVFSCKIIFNNINKISKGFGFVYFSNYLDYQNVLNNKEKKYFKGNLLKIK